MLVASAVDRGVDLRSGQTKGYKIGFCCLSIQDTSVWRESEQRLIVSELG